VQWILGLTADERGQIYLHEAIPAAGTRYNIRQTFGSRKQSPACGGFFWASITVRKRGPQLGSARAPASSRRDAIPSLRYALLRCTSTVFGVTYRI